MPSLDDASAAHVHRVLAQDALRAKRLRGEFFDSQFVSGPAWELLLILYEAALEERLVSLEQVQLSCTAPFSVLLRWTDALVQEELVRIDDRAGLHPVLCLSAKGLTLMSSYFERLRASDRRMDAEIYEWKFK